MFLVEHIMNKDTCSKCDLKKEHDTKRYCASCTNAYNREWRKTHPLSEKQKIKDIVRHKTMMRIRRGLLIRQPCEMCGCKNVQAHHEDYSKPYQVMWFCRKCHLDWHKMKKGLQIE